MFWLRPHPKMYNSVALLVLSLPCRIFRSNAYSNIYGGTLKSCSSAGMALTGYTRNGFCVDKSDDSGSHHICIDLSSATGGNFCDVTGQNDWCSSEMTCQPEENEDAAENDELCPVQNWCVCQWAFASYIEKAGGCSMIQDVVCDAINVEAVYAYQRSHQSKYVNALKCIEEKCGGLSVKYWLHSKPKSMLSVVGLLLGGVLLGIAWYMQRGPPSEKEEKLVPEHPVTAELA
uniref:Folate receptor-like domain-containing protein n=1 Tax=Trieres chinensis TaxID=1514140 RepID=A0A7S2EVP0_TRICV|mmetsp:Transcript_4944/g.10393  ORF Transcript_4944/g.10393 Transcript_4944/m.10393 type:complete len:232 (+) Transcript_4944:149-844(+)